MAGWFATTDLAGLPDPGRRIAYGVVALLEELQPARLRPGDQQVEISDRDPWVTLTLQHDSEPLLQIEMSIGPASAEFWGVMAHDEVYSVRPDPPDQWETDTLEILAELLQADYAIETLRRRGRQWDEMAEIGESHPVSFVRPRWLRIPPWPRRVGGRTASFGCRGAAAVLRDPPGAQPGADAY